MDSVEKKAEDLRIKTVDTAAKLRNKLVVVLCIIALGCAAGIFTIQQSSNHRADKNTCGIQAFLESSKLRSIQTRLPGYKVQVARYQFIQNELKPSLDTCIDDHIVDLSPIFKVSQ